ncbi:MAG TPA: DUF1573 domain-containing protein [Lacunisphaera sp.]|nr:DUF1573 domain-containing protein [Lacunisphaera sp.]
MRPGLMMPAQLILALALPAFAFGALTWTNQSVEATAKPDDKQLNAVFHFTNAGNEPIMIKEIQPCCGCTTVDLPKRTYAPGESGDITAVYTVEKAKGRHRKLITVITDEPSAKPAELVFFVTIPDTIAYEPRMLLWRVGDRLDAKTVAISSPTDRKIAGIAIQSIAPEEAAIAQIEPAPAGGIFNLLVRPASTFKNVQVAISCLATLDNGRTEPLTVYVLVR